MKLIHAGAFPLFVCFLLFGGTGCIVHDQLATLTVNPDGSGDVVVFRSNIRSTASGEVATAEFAEYQAAFDDRSQDIFQRIRESGSDLAMASWVRRAVPAANVIRASLPDARALEEFLTVRGGDGSIIVKPDYSVSNSRRRLSFRLFIDPDAVRVVDEDNRDQKRASGISELRIAVSRGTITDSRGFIVAGDKSSALIDEAGIRSLLVSGGQGVDIFVQWEVSSL